MLLIITRVAKAKSPMTDSFSVKTRLGIIQYLVILSSINAKYLT